MANAPHTRQTSSTTLTIRVAGGTKQKNEWKAKARKAGMSLTLYVCYVMDRTNLVVSMSHEPDPKVSQVRRGGAGEADGSMTDDAIAQRIIDDHGGIPTINGNGKPSRAARRRAAT